MPIFFVDAEAIHENSILLGARNSAHVKALRLRPGESIVVSDGCGREYQCRYGGLFNGEGMADIVSVSDNQTEPSVRVSLYVSLPKGDKAELILQKAVELGAFRVSFFLSSRSVSRPDSSAVRKRMERLARVSEEAAMQSGRGIIPEVCWLPDFQAMTEHASQDSIRLFLWEEAQDDSLRSALMASRNAQNSISLITGPEGGFSREEAETARKAGLLPVTLGKRILRCETAPICALSAVMYETGNLE